MNTKIFIKVSLLSISLTLYPMESLKLKTRFDRVIGTIGQSEFVHQASRIVAYQENLVLRSIVETEMEAKTRTIVETEIEAEIKKIGHEAQDNVGILVERHLPILVRPPNGTNAAYTTPAAIHVPFEGFFSTDSPCFYGNKRCMLHHEAVHAKYHDPVARSLISIASMASGLFLSTIVKKTYRYKLMYPIFMAAGLMAGIKLNKKYRKYAEHRAEIEGYYATQCYECLEENILLDQFDESFYVERFKTKAHKKLLELGQEDNGEIDAFVTDSLKEAHESHTKEGYLSREEKKIIWNDLKQQGKLCRFHVENSWLLATHDPLSR